MLKKYGAVIAYILLIIADIFWLSTYSDYLFDPRQSYLFLFITTRIAILMIAFVMHKKSGNWFYTILTVAYLLFSFAIASLFYITANSAGIS